MFMHSLRLFIRSFRSNFTINLFNLLGLSAGLAACMLIIVYLHHEFDYDSFHDNANRIVRINTDQNVGEGQEIHLPTASYPVAEGLTREISGIENYVRFRFSRGARPVYVDDQIFFEDHLVWADSTVFDIFSYRLILGDPKTALARSGSVVLSETTARKFFGETDPIGRFIQLRKDRNYAVTGVMEDIPQPSHLPSFPMIFSLTSLEIGGPDYWVGRSVYGSYVLLAEGQSAEYLQPVVNEVYQERAGELMKLMGAECRVTLQPLRSIHFDDSFDFAFDYQPPVTYQKLFVFALIAAFILIIASVSFINLATARSGERARQVGIRKAIGASRRALGCHFMGEFLITSFAALAIAFLLVHLLLPVFSDFVGRELTLDYSAKPLLPIVFVALAVLVGLLSGIYPALFLSSFRPSETIRGNLFSGSRHSRLRPALILFQFAVSILLVICTVTVIHQLNYMSSRHPGFDKEQLLVLTVAPDMTQDNCELIRNKALEHPGILSGTLSSYLPTMGHMENTYEVPDPVNCEMLMTRQFIVDEWFIETMGMELVAGRNFNRGSPEAIGQNVIINETAVRTLGYEDPVGMLLDAHPAKGAENYKPVTIIGVVKDINFESYHHEIEPMLLIRAPGRPGKIALRIHPASIQEAIQHVEQIWKANFPQAPFQYRFLDENFEMMYSAEIRLSKLISFFTGLAIVISCIGLLSLIAFSAERRTREIGIRKVLGATQGNLFYLLSSEYLRLVLLANLVAWPIAGWAMT